MLYSVPFLDLVDRVGVWPTWRFEREKRSQAGLGWCSIVVG